MTLQDPFLRQPDSGFNRLEGWSWIGCYGGYYLQSDLLQSHGFEHGFFTRLWQGRGPDELAGYISAGISVHRPQQVHGSKILNADQATAPPWPDADGLISSRGSQSLWVCGADCTPVLLADPASGHVAACHAGWRGVAARILVSAVSKLEQRGARREQLIVAMGPAVSGANYQVGRDVVERISASLGHGTDWSALISAGVVLEDPQPDRYRLDLRVAAREQLVQSGLQPESISHCPLCTVEEDALFHSWRRDQVKAVQWSGIVSQVADARI